MGNREKMDSEQIIYRVKFILFEYDKPNAHVSSKDTLEKIQDALDGAE
jgi:hypothetical protein